MKKAEMVAELTERGIDRLYSKQLSKLKKRELEEAYQAITSGAPRHLSHSQVQMYKRCGMQYYFRYIRQMVRPPNAFMTWGGAVDTAENHNYESKIDSGEDEPESVLTDVYAEDFKARKDQTDWQGEKPEDWESNGLGLVKLFRADVAPRTEPIAVQKEYSIEFDNVPFTFLGYADLIAVESDINGNGLYEVIIDNKCSKRTPPEGLIRIHPQLTAYAACYQAQKGQVAAVGLNVLVSRKKENEAVFQRSIRTEHDINRYWKTVQTVYQSICAGIFVPASEINGSMVNWVCTPERCGWWDICHEEF